MKEFGCAIAAKEFRENYQNEEMVEYLKTKRCQFEKVLEPEYKYNDEYFCLLHLSLKEKIRLRLLSKFQEVFYEAILWMP